MYNDRTRLDKVYPHTSPLEFWSHYDFDSCKLVQDEMDKQIYLFVDDGVLASYIWTYQIIPCSFIQRFISYKTSGSVSFLIITEDDIGFLILYDYIKPIHVHDSVIEVNSKGLEFFRKKVQEAVYNEVAPYG